MGRVQSKEGFRNPVIEMCSRTNGSLIIPTSLYDNKRRADGSRPFTSSQKKFLIFIYRKTLGFQKYSDYISRSQIVEEGEISKNVISGLIEFCEANGFITVERSKKTVDGEVSYRKGERQENLYTVSFKELNKLICYINQVEYVEEELEVCAEQFGELELDVMEIDLPIREIFKPVYNEPVVRAMNVMEF